MCNEDVLNLDHKDKSMKIKTKGEGRKLNKLVKLFNAKSKWL